MGDILHALPAVTALRQAHPKWYLGWAVQRVGVRFSVEKWIDPLGKGKRMGSFSAQA